MDPLFSVVMAARNSAPTLRRSLATFLEPPREDVEIVVIDDASTDDTQGVLSELPNSERVRTIRMQVQVGQTQALNIGIKAARGRFIVRQDADDYSHPDRLDAQYRDYCGSGVLDILGTGHTVILENGGRISIPGRNFRDIKNRISRGPVFCHGSLMMRRDSLLRLGGYDDFFRYAQDADLIIRAAHAGMALRNVRACLYEWTDSPRSITSTRYHEQASYEELALERIRRPNLELGPAFQTILSRNMQFPLSRQYRNMVLYLAAGETHLARQEFNSMKERGEPIPDSRRYSSLVRVPKTLYRLLRRLRDLG